MQKVIHAVNASNEKVLGKFKDEENGNIIKEVNLPKA